MYRTDNLDQTWRSPAPFVPPLPFVRDIAVITPRVNQSVGRLGQSYA